MSNRKTIRQRRALERFTILDRSAWLASRYPSYAPESLGAILLSAKTAGEYDTYVARKRTERAALAKVEV